MEEEYTYNGTMMLLKPRYTKLPLAFRDGSASVGIPSRQWRCVRNICSGSHSCCLWYEFFSVESPLDSLRLSATLEFDMSL